MRVKAKLHADDCGIHGDENYCTCAGKSSALPTCSIVDSRKEFEAWITKPPFECNIDRYPNDPGRYGWPGAYHVYEVELAWEAWQAARQ